MRHSSKGSAQVRVRPPEHFPQHLNANANPNANANANTNPKPKPKPNPNPNPGHPNILLSSPSCTEARKSNTKGKGSG